jgi:8-oxo-dGTP diphosphatase
LRGDGFVLLADRPAGKPFAGYWEFPGGKIEPGEPVAEALSRELHEELGIDIGPSTPWVTFEFDYPHAYVELQFRRVRDWRGEPHAREGQRLRFVDPAGELPQPLLPAAVPALRWLLLPRTAIVVTAPDVTSATKSASAPWPVAGTTPQLVIVQANWLAGHHRSEQMFSRLRHRSGSHGSIFLASGPGARQAAGASGVVFDNCVIGETPAMAGAWNGAWVDSEHDARLAAGRGFDFIVVRSSRLGERLREKPAALPAYFPAEPATETMASLGGEHGQGVWVDLRWRTVLGGSALCQD